MKQKDDPAFIGNVRVELDAADNYHEAPIMHVTERTGFGVQINGGSTH